MAERNVALLRYDFDGKIVTNVCHALYEAAVLDVTAAAESRLKHLLPIDIAPLMNGAAGVAVLGVGIDNVFVRNKGGIRWSHVYRGRHSTILHAHYRIGVIRERSPCERSSRPIVHHCVGQSCNDMQSRDFPLTRRCRMELGIDRSSFSFTPGSGWVAPLTGQSDGRSGRDWGGIGAPFRRPITTL